jgi:Lipopolysaccharide kinase (Kdo/WaaP) family
MRELPPGYDRLHVGRATAVAAREVAPLVREALAMGTLYDFARRRPDAHELTGRQPAYAILHPAGDARMVVRHNRHGGFLAALTGDRFLPPTRAPHEFALSTRLTAADVPTPRLLAYAVYRAGIFARSDVVTRMAWPSWDLARALAEATVETRRRDLDLTATLVATLSRAGARHHDLNAKNVLIGVLDGSMAGGGSAPAGDRPVPPPAPAGARLQAIVLDVDRVTFDWAPELALAHNLARLDRSLRKRRALFPEPISNDEIATLARVAAERM